MKKNLKHIHFIGIKGVAMTGLAVMAKQKGIKVTGSDVSEVFVTDDILKRNKISWSEGFRKENIPGKPDLVVVTGAHGGMTNEEAKAAKSIGLTVMMHGQALGYFMEDYRGISVCGSHGKTTTTAMIASVLKGAGLSPSFAVGCSDVAYLNGASGFGKGQFFVAEADEYVNCPQTDKTPRFLYQKPEIIVVTNIEFDHPDVFNNLENVKNAYREFFEKLPKHGLLVACIDDAAVRGMVEDISGACCFSISRACLLAKIKREVITYGISEDAQWQVKNIRSSFGKTSFEVVRNGFEYGSIVLKLPGKHNALNATAALVVSSYLGVPLEKAKKALFDFSGTKRRFEFIGEEGGVLLYDDYAHHPTEIATTLKACKNWFYKRRLICVFQPHTYSRTKALFEEFASSFMDADIIVLADIYSSKREKDNLGMDSKVLTEAIKKYKKEAVYGGNMSSVVKYVGRMVRSGDVIITMGAGDIFLYHQQILAEIDGRKV